MWNCGTIFSILVTEVVPFSLWIMVILIRRSAPAEANRYLAHNLWKISVPKRKKILILESKLSSPISQIYWTPPPSLRPCPVINVFMSCHRFKGMKVVFKAIQALIVLLFRFPKDKELCEMWIHNLRRENYVPSASAVICCEHFEDSCYECYASPRKLKPGTVPTIFQYPSHLPKVNTSFYISFYSCMTNSFSFHE